MKKSINKRCLAHKIIVLAIAFAFIGVNLLFGQITYISSETNATNVIILTIDKPIGLALNDVMFLQIVQSGNKGTLSDPEPAGWTKIAGSYLRNLDNNNCRSTLFYKIADSNDVSADNYVFTLVGADDAIGAINIFRYVDISDIFSAIPGTDYTNIRRNTNVLADAITPSTDSSTVIMFTALQDNNNYPVISGWSTVLLGGLDEIYNIAFDGHKYLGLGAAWSIQNTAGNTGQGRATLEETCYNGSLLIALRPLSGYQITHVNTEISSTNTKVLTIEKPDGLAVNDVMMMQIVQTNYKAAFNDPEPDGWIKIAGSDIRDIITMHCRATLFYKIADSNDISADNYIFPLVGADDALGAINIFRYVDISDIFSAIPGTDYTNIRRNRTVLADAITPLADSSAVIMFTALQDNINYPEISGWRTALLGELDEIYDIAFDGFRYLGLGSAWSIQNTADNTGQGQASLVSLCVNGSILVSLRPVYYTLTAGGDGHGSVALNPVGGTHIGGSTVTLTPVPDVDYEFDYWSGDNADDVINTNGVYTILMDGNKNLIANFKEHNITGNVISRIVLSNETPQVNEQITATVYIDMSGVEAPYNYLGTYAGTLNWDPNILSFNNYSGSPPLNFTGSVDISDVADGIISFDASSISGSTGNLAVLTVVFDVLRLGTSPLEHFYSVMATTPNDKNILTVLMLFDSQVEVTGPPNCEVMIDGPVSIYSDLSVSVVNIPHTTGSGTDRLILLGLEWYRLLGNTITSVTFIPSVGDELTLSPVIFRQHDTENRYSAIYSLLDPPANTAGMIEIIFSANCNNIVAGVVNFKGVDQAIPVGTPGSASGHGNNPNITLSGLKGDELIFDNVYRQSNREITASAGQTENWNAAVGTIRGASSIKPALGNTSVKMDWTAASLNNWVITAVPVNPVQTNTWLGTATGDENNWNNPDNWCKGVPSAGTDVVISSYSANQPVIPASPEAECNNLTIKRGASLTIESGQALTVNGSLDVIGSLIIESSGVTSSGSLIVRGSSSGNIVYNRPLRPKANDGDKILFSSPLGGQNIPDFISAFNDKIDSVRTWDEVNAIWYKITSGQYISGKGYNIYQSEGSDGVFSFIGSVVNTASVTATSPYRDPYSSRGSDPYGNDDPDADIWAEGRSWDDYGGGGWNLLGNPFTSSMDASLFISTNLESFDPYYQALYLYDGINDVYKYVAASTPGYPEGVGSHGIYIQSGQGFMVLANNNGAQFDFTSSMQIHNTGSVFLKSAKVENPWPGLQLKVKYGEKESQTLIVYNQEMSVGLDLGYDVGQLSTGPEVEIYTAFPENDEGVNLVRQALPVMGADKIEVPVGIDTEKGGEITFSAYTIPLGNNKFWLEDRATGSFTNLNTDSYSVVLPGKTYGTGRFYILASSNMPTAIEHFKMDDYGLRIWNAYDKLIIQGEVSNKAVCSIYDLQGRKFLEHRLDYGEMNTINLPRGMQGIYIVRVTDNYKVTTRKVLFF